MTSCREQDVAHDEQQPRQVAVVLPIRAQAQSSMSSSAGSSSTSSSSTNNFLQQQQQQQQQSPFPSQHLHAHAHLPPSTSDLFSSTFAILQSDDASTSSGTPVTSSNSAGWTAPGGNMLVDWSTSQPSSQRLQHHHQTAYYYAHPLTDSGGAILTGSGLAPEPLVFSQPSTSAPFGYHHSNEQSGVMPLCHYSTPSSGTPTSASALAIRLGTANNANPNYVQHQLQLQPESRTNGLSANGSQQQQQQHLNGTSPKTSALVPSALGINGLPRSSGGKQQKPAHLANMDVLTAPDGTRMPHPECEVLDDERVMCMACRGVYPSRRSLTGHIGRNEKCREIIGRNYLDQLSAAESAAAALAATQGTATTAISATTNGSQHSSTSSSSSASGSEGGAGGNGSSSLLALSQHPTPTIQPSVATIGSSSSSSPCLLPPQVPLVNAAQLIVAQDGISPICPHCDRFISHYKGNIRRHINQCGKGIKRPRKAAGAESSTRRRHKKKADSMTPGSESSTSSAMDESELHPRDPCPLSSSSSLPPSLDPLYQQSGAAMTATACETATPSGGAHLVIYSPSSNRAPPPQHHFQPHHHHNGCGGIELAGGTPVGAVQLHSTMMTGGPSPTHLAAPSMQAQQQAQSASLLSESPFLHHHHHHHHHHQHPPPMLVVQPPSNPSLPLLQQQHHAAMLASPGSASAVSPFGGNASFPLTDILTNGALPTDMRYIRPSMGTDDPFVCPFCEFLTQYKGNMKRHLNTCHHITEDDLKDLDTRLEDMRASVVGVPTAVLVDKVREAKSTALRARRPRQKDPERIAELKSNMLQMLETRDSIRDRTLVWVNAPDPSPADDSSASSTPAPVLYSHSPTGMFPIQQQQQQQPFQPVIEDWKGSPLDSTINEVAAGKSHPSTATSSS